MQIQWTVLNIALWSLPCDDQWWITLFIHNKLLLHASKFHPHLGSPLCPSCQCQPEELWHFLECHHREQWHLFEQLKKQLIAITTKLSLHPSFLTMYWLSLLTVHNHTLYPNVTDDLPPILHLAVQHQLQLWLGTVIPWMACTGLGMSNWPTQPHHCTFWSPNSCLHDSSHMDIHLEHVVPLQPAPTPRCGSTKSSWLQTSSYYGIWKWSTTSTRSPRSTIPPTSGSIIRTTTEHTLYMAQMHSQIHEATI